MNPAFIRKIMVMIKSTGLVNVRPGVAGAELAKNLSEITLFDVYQAVDVVKEDELFSIHEHLNPACPVGRNIQDAIGPLFSIAQTALEKAFGNVTIEDVVKDIIEKEQVSK